MGVHRDDDLVGYVALRVGSMDLRVPIVSGEPIATDEAPTASFEADGDDYAIVLHGEVSPSEVPRAVREAAETAMKHLSRKLLN